MPIWATAPAPAGLTVRTVAGNDGSDRIELTWPNAVISRWQQVTLEATAHTGLAAPMVFHLDNLIGDANGNTLVTASDVALAKSDNGNTAGIMSIADFNRSGAPTAADIAIAKFYNAASISLAVAPAGLRPIRQMFKWYTNDGNDLTDVFGGSGSASGSTAALTQRAGALGPLLSPVPHRLLRPVDRLPPGLGASGDRRGLLRAGRDGAEGRGSLIAPRHGQGITSGRGRSTPRWPSGSGPR